MTTDAATPAAEATTEVTTEEQPKIADPQLEDTQTTATAESADETVAASEEAEASADAEVDTEFDWDKALEARGLTSAEETSQQIESLGTTAAQRELATFEQLRANTNAFMQTTEAQFQEFAKTNLNLQPAQATAIWRALRQKVQDAATMPNRAVNQLLVEDLDEAFGSEFTNKLFEGDKQFPSRPAMFKELSSRIRADVEAEWNAKKGKEWIPVKDAKEITDEAVTRAEARIRKQVADGTFDSGQNVEGTPPATTGANRRFRTRPEADAAFNNGEITREHWKRETDRLKGAA